MIGKTKLPSAAGIDGMMKRNTMIAPCSVNMRLYVSAPMIVRPGVSSSRRTRSAKMPPRMNANRIEARYMMPIRLWSSVVSQLFRPFGVLR